jgi:hypothetical protein
MTGIPFPWVSACSGTPSLAVTVGIRSLAPQDFIDIYSLKVAGVH